MTWSASSERTISRFLVLHTGHFSAERFGNLHGKGTHTTRGAVDQNLVPGCNLSFIAQGLQGGHCRYRHGCRLLECDTGSFQYRGFFTSADILGKAAPTTS